MASHSFKTGLTILLICFYSSHSFSQDIYSSKESSRFSFTLGMTSTSLLKDTFGYKSGILFNGGFMYSVAVSEKFNVGANLLYTGKSLKNDSPIIKYRYFYIDLPIFMQYQLSDNIRINLGGQYSWHTNSKVIVIDGSNSTGINIEKSGSIKDNDYGFLAGAEIDLNHAISLAARYTLSGSTFFEKNKINFGVFQFSINYLVYSSHKNFFSKNKIDKQ